MHLGGGGVERVVVEEGDVALGQFETGSARELWVELHNKIKFVC